MEAHTWVPSLFSSKAFTLSVCPLSFISFAQVLGSHTLRTYINRNRITALTFFPFMHFLYIIKPLWINWPLSSTRTHPSPKAYFMRTGYTTTSYASLINRQDFLPLIVMAFVVSDVICSVFFCCLLKTLMNGSNWKKDSVMCEKKKNSENSGLVYSAFIFILTWNFWVFFLSL